MSKYLSILTADIANGSGFRVSVWLSGCHRHCKGCFNPQSWDFNAGKEFGNAALDKIENELKKDWINGSAILGGEPLEQINLNAVKTISRLTRSYGKDVWLWTGYYLDELNAEQLNAIKDVSVLIDGPFIREQHKVDLKWRRVNEPKDLDEGFKREMENK